MTVRATSWRWPRTLAAGRRRLLRPHLRGRRGDRVALVPLGYADGVPRHAGVEPAEVLVGGARAAGARPDLHGPVRRRPRRRRRQRRRRGRALRPGCPRGAHRDGLGRWCGRSTTRSSPGWAAGCPAPTWMRQRGRRPMSTRRSLAYAAGGLGAAARRGRAPPACVVERRVVKARRAGAAEADRLGALRSEPRRGQDRRRRRRSTPRSTRWRRTPRRRGGVVAADHAGLRPRLRAEPRLLALPARGPARPAPDGLLRPALARPVRPLGPRARHHRPARRRPACASSRSSAPDGDVVLVGHSMGGMSIIALAEQHPELFAERVRGVALISTTAGGLQAHRTLSRWIPDGLGQLVAPRLVAALAKAPELVDSARRPGSQHRRSWWPTSSPSATRTCRRRRWSSSTRCSPGPPFDVLAEFFPCFSALDKFDHLGRFARVPTTVICGTRTSSPRSGTAASWPSASPARRSSSARAPATW